MKLKNDVSVLEGEQKKLNDENIFLKNNQQKHLKEIKELNKRKIYSIQKVEEVYINYKDYIIQNKYLINPKSIGLSFIGICYMNSILQCFNHTESLTNFFLKKRVLIKEKENLELSKIYLELIEKLWIENKSKTFEPYRFRNEITRRDESIKNNSKYDIEKFILLFLNDLHNELKELEQNKKDSHNYININTELLLNMKQNEKDEFHKTNEIINLGKSVISNLFFGLMQIGYECLICKDNKKNYAYEIFRYHIPSWHSIFLFYNYSSNNLF
jgi:ubiquitin C-terminal hydrolase